MPTKNQKRNAASAYTDFELHHVTLWISPHWPSYDHHYRPEPIHPARRFALPSHHTRIIAGDTSLSRSLNTDDDWQTDGTKLPGSFDTDDGWQTMTVYPPAPPRIQSPSCPFPKRVLPWAAPTNVGKTSPCENHP